MPKRGESRKAGPLQRHWKPRFGRRQVSPPAMRRAARCLTNEARAVLPPAPDHAPPASKETAECPPWPGDLLDVGVLPSQACCSVELGARQVLKVRFLSGPKSSETRSRVNGSNGAHWGDDLESARVLELLEKSWSPCAWYHVQVDVQVDKFHTNRIAGHVSGHSGG